MFIWKEEEKRVKIVNYKRSQKLKEQKMKWSWKWDSIARFLSRCSANEKCALKKEEGNTPSGTEWEGWCFLTSLSSVSFLSRLHSLFSSQQFVMQRKTKTVQKKRFAKIKSNWSRKGVDTDSDNAILFETFSRLSFSSVGANEQEVFQCCVQAHLRRRSCCIFLCHCYSFESVFSALNPNLSFSSSKSKGTVNKQ